MTTKTQMRTVVILIFMSVVSSLLSQGQSIPIDESLTPARTYHLLREDDDRSFLAMVDWELGSLIAVRSRFRTEEPW
ncbi:MAG TPA: hypothetical protein VK638_55695 [Edaphobacter sp.]|nr:hypothetical protein [Edaphobacter sp.]